MMRKKVCVATATVLMLTMPAAAQAQDGPYVALRGGLNFMGDSDVDIPQDTSPIYDSLSYDTGVSVSGAAGYSFDLDGDPSKGFEIRPEVELGYKYNSLDSIGLTPAGGTGSNSLDGEFSQFNGMANVWVGYQIGRFTPYVGGGVGLARVSVNDLEDNALNNRLDDSDTVFAYQVGVGAAYSLTTAIDVTLDYRYMGMDTAEYTSPGGAGVEIEHDNHSAMVGIQYGF